jgi:hypothetical protein
MIPNLNSAILLVVVGAPTLILVIFLPAVLELRKPRDGGPRIIMNDLHGMVVRSFSAATLVNIEEEMRFERSLLVRLVQVIEGLPCLEV